MILTRRRSLRIAACVVCGTTSLFGANASAQGIGDHTEDEAIVVVAPTAVGVPGKDGLDGVPGSPGGAGGAGGAGTADFRNSTTDGMTSTESIAAAGGTGGRGGSGGDSSMPGAAASRGGDGGTGGAANADLVSLTFGSSWSVRSQATGGGGGDGGGGGTSLGAAGSGGTGGDAIAIARTGTSASSSAFAQAQGGDGGDAGSFDGGLVPDESTHGGGGGDAWSESVAGSYGTGYYGDGDVLVESFAVGGRAGQRPAGSPIPPPRSGDAYASSTASTSTGQSVVALSDARAHASYVGADVELLALNGDVSAISDASGRDHASAIARTFGSGTVDAVAIARGVAPVFVVRSALHVAPGMSAEYASLAGLGEGGQWQFADAGGVIGLAAPERDTVTALLDGEILSSDAIGGATNVLGLGQFGASSGRSLSGSVTFSLRPSSLDATESVFLAFQKPDRLTSGFEALNVSVYLDEVALLQLAFDDVSVADEVLAGIFLPVSSSSSEDDATVEVRVAVELDFADPAQTFFLDVALLATAVDEPQPALLFALVLAALALARLKQDHA